MIITTNKYKTIATSTYLKKIKKRIWPIKDRQGVMENIGPVHFSEINISKTQQIPLIQPSLSPTQYSPLLASFSFSSFFCLSVHPWLRLHFHVSLSCISSNNWCAYRRNHLPLIMGFNNYIYLPLFFSFLLYLGFQVICRRGYERHWYPCWLDYLSWFPQNPWGDSDFTNPTNSTSTLVSPMGFTGAFFFSNQTSGMGFSYSRLIPPDTHVLWTKQGLTMFQDILTNQSCYFHLVFHRFCFQKCLLGLFGNSPCLCSLIRIKG